VREEWSKTMGQDQKAAGDNERSSGGRGWRGKLYRVSSE
jgi:hypothetical protein